MNGQLPQRRGAALVSAAVSWCCFQLSIFFDSIQRRAWTIWIVASKMDYQHAVSNPENENETSYNLGWKTGHNLATWTRSGGKNSSQLAQQREWTLAQFGEQQVGSELKELEQSNSGGWQVQSHWISLMWPDSLAYQCHATLKSAKIWEDKQEPVLGRFQWHHLEAKARKEQILKEW